MAKLKEFSITTYYRGIEMNKKCITTSKKRASEIFDTTLSFMNGYSHTIEPKTQEAIDNIDTVFCRVGMGGEARYIFEVDKVYTLDEYKRIIDEHRVKYPSYHHYSEYLKSI